MSIHQSLYQALAILGSSADEVADRLYEMGFRGRPFDSGDCPMTRYLSETIHLKVSVGTDLVEIGPFCYPLPEPCSEFIHLFDAGKWPLLVEEARHAPECPNLPDDCRCSG